MGGAQIKEREDEEKRRKRKEGGLYGGDVILTWRMIGLLFDECFVDYALTHHSIEFCLFSRK